MAILAVNAGSSSLKFSLHPLQDGQVQPYVLSGCIQGLEPQGTPVMDWVYLGKKHSEPLAVSAGSSSFESALQSLRALVHRLEAAPDIQAVSHRVVHGGGVFTGPVLVTDEVLADIQVLWRAVDVDDQRRMLEALRQSAATLNTSSCSRAACSP
jgi:acetate kinase